MLGYEITCFCSVSMQPLTRETSTAFIEQAKKIPEIVECYTVTGDSAFILKIVAKSFQYYRDFIFDKLLAVPNVSNIETTVIVGTEKKSSCIPL